MNIIKDKIRQQLTEKAKKIQPSIDKMLANPATKRYVEQACLSLIDSRFENIDKLLHLGILKGYKS